MSKEKDNVIEKMIAAAKRRLIRKAARRGLWENFGCKEIRKIEDQNSRMHDVYSQEWREANRQIQEFFEWCGCYEVPRETVGNH